MTHEDITALLHELHAGKLSSAQAREVQEHLAVCDDCRALSLTWRVLRGAVAGTTPTAGDHLSTEEVVSLAIGPEALPAASRLRLESHLESCTDCANEVDRCRKADLPFAGEKITIATRVSPARAWNRWGALAAGILVALLIYPAYLGIVRLPEVQSAAETAGARAKRLTTEADRLRSALDTHQDLSGSTRLHLLTDLTRGGESYESMLVLRQDDPFVLICVDLLLPEAVPDDTDVTFTVVGETGTPVVTIARSAALVRNDIGESGVVTLIMAASRVPGGSYHLQVTTGSPAELLFESRFRVFISP